MAVTIIVRVHISTGLKLSFVAEQNESGGLLLLHTP
jgi:hypothetical protein